MIELMIKMTFWLIAAMLLGFTVAWLLSKVFYRKRQSYDEDALSAIVLERNNMITKLEKSFRHKKIMFEKVSENLQKSETSLAEKTSLLTTLQNKLVNVNANKNDSLALKEKNNLLLLEIQKLKQTDKKRVEELEGFEEILLLAEEKVDENEKSYRKILKNLDDDIEYLTLENEKNVKNIKLYETNIKDFEEELRLYAADSSSPEFIISKDQFLKIEEQLEVYQKEIKFLKNENNELIMKSQKGFSGFHLDENILDKKIVNKLQKASDDSSMVKVFRETYKKITNS